MEGILKVTPEKLVEASSEFNAVGERIRSLTGEMSQAVKGLKSVWQGEAAQMYGSRFDALQGDMNKMYRMICEHVNDMQEMARQYQNAETVNTEEGSALGVNILT